MNSIEYVAFIGLDWGDKTHAFALQLAAADSVETGTIGSDPTVLHEWIESLKARMGGGLVALATEGGSKSLLAAMAEHAWIHVYPIHPATCDRFRRTFQPSGAKDDIPDAQTLLTLLRNYRNRLQRLLLDTPQTRRLAALTQARRQAVDRRTQVTSQLRTLLKSYYPQALELVGDELERPLALDFLQRWPELASLKGARATTLRAFYREHAVRRDDVIERRIELVRTSRALTTDNAVIEPAVMHLQLLLDIIRAQQKHILCFDERIGTAFAEHPRAALFRNLPGAGATFAPRLLVAFGDNRARYPAAVNLQMYAGVAPVQKRSGKQLWIHWRWLAPVFLRQTFVEWSAQTVIYCPWAHAYYYRQKAAGKSRQAILRSLAFKWIRILWKCWQTGVPYDDGQYLAALKRRGSPLIEALAAA
jgi:hypothetical protein